MATKTSEAGFKEQFDLYQLRLKEEEERKYEMLRKQKEEEERKQEMLRKQKAEEEERKQEIIRKQKEEERKRVEWVGKHKQKVAAMGDESKKLQAYVRKHFDQQRTLLNHQGEKGYCNVGCKDMNNNQHVLSQQRWNYGYNLYVQCWMLYALYFENSNRTYKAAILLSLDDPVLTNYWARI